LFRSFHGVDQFGVISGPCLPVLIGCDVSVIASVFPGGGIFSSPKVLGGYLGKRFEGSPVPDAVSALNGTPVIKDDLVHYEQAMLIVMVVELDEVNVVFQYRSGITASKRRKHDG